MLRTAQALVAANVPQRRINRSMRELRRHLPEAMPLSGLAIDAVADRVVVREGSSRWQADSGQYLLEFAGDPARGSLNVKPGTVPFSHMEERSAIREKGTVPGWFERGVALEGTDPKAAMQAYGKAIAEDPANVDARINLGLLLHEAGRLREAERVYRDALDACGGDPVLLFNVGVLLEDLDRKPEAMEAYAAALRLDPGMADCHYNLALLCRELGKPRDAIRHMSEYRRLAQD